MDMSDLPNPCEVSAMYMVHPAEDGGDDTIFARQSHWLSVVPRMIVQVKHAWLLCFSRHAMAQKQHYCQQIQTPKFALRHPAAYIHGPIACPGLQSLRAPSVSSTDKLCTHTYKHIFYPCL